MKLSSPKPSPSPSLRLLSAALLTLAAAAACGDDEAPPAPQPDFGVRIASLDGASPEAVTLRCDGTLAVAVAITTSIDKVTFKLSPADACGQSKRCGYVRVEGLNASGEVLSQVDSVTTQAVLELASDERDELARIRVSLIRGLDQTTLINQDGAEVTSEITPDIALEPDCDAAPGAGGQGGAGAGGEGGLGEGGLGGAAAGAPSGGAGGAGGSETAGAPGLGGEGGQPSEGGAAGLGQAGLGAP